MVLSKRCFCYNGTIKIGNRCMEKIKQIFLEKIINVSKQKRIIQVIVTFSLIVMVSFSLGYANQQPIVDQNIDELTSEVLEVEEIEEINDFEDELEADEESQETIQRPTGPFSQIVHYNYAPLASLSTDELKALNANYVSWIRINGTVINHPVVQGKDNVFYLTNTFQKTRTKYGSIYMDYRNNQNYSDKHIIMYGHHMKDGTMFRDLDKYKNKSYLSGRETITIRTLKGTRTYRIFSVYTGTAEDMKIIGPSFSKPLSFYIDRYKEKSLYDINVDVSKATQMLTLSACNYDYVDGRVLVHAVLVSINE